MKLTLEQWGLTLPINPHINTLRRWARDGHIYPPPIKMGRQYVVEANAIYVNPKSDNIPSPNVRRILEHAAQTSQGS